MSPKQIANKKMAAGLFTGVIIALVFGALALISWLLPNLIPNLTSDIPMTQIFMYIAIFVLIVTLIASGKRATKIADTYCDSCGEKYEVHNVSPQIVKTEIYNSKAKSTVRFNCTCSSCGRSKSFTKEFTVGYVDANGNVTEYNLEELALKYFN